MQFLLCIYLFIYMCKMEINFFIVWKLLIFFLQPPVSMIKLLLNNNIDRHLITLSYRKIAKGSHGFYSACNSIATRQRSPTHAQITSALWGSTPFLFFIISNYFSPYCWKYCEYYCCCCFFFFFLFAWPMCKYVNI